MTDTTWRGQSAIIEIDALAVGMLQNVEVSFSQELTKARGSGDDVSVQDIMKTAVEPQISGEFLSFDVAAVQSLMDWDEAQSQLDLTAEVARFDVTARVDAANGDELEVKLDNAWMEDGPTISAGREDFLGLEVTFEGPTFTNIEEVSGA